MKSYTSLEQSKKLSEILPLESADMYYVLIDTDEDKYDAGLGKYIGILPHYPCWSLAALLEIIPAKLEDNHYLTLDKESYKEFDEYCCCYEDCNGDSFHNFFGKNPIDACYEMILKLDEQKRYCDYDRRRSKS